VKRHAEFGFALVAYFHRRSVLAEVGAFEGDK
jgi:hypothetical protein